MAATVVFNDVDETADAAPEWYNKIVIALAQEKPDDALRQGLEAVANCKKASDKAGEVAALRAVTKANIAKNDMWNGKRTADEGLQLAKDSKDKSGEAAALTTLAAFHLKERKPDQAKFRALAALEAYKGLQDQMGEAVASNLLALAYLAKKELQQSQELADQAFKIFKAQIHNGGMALTTYTSVQIALAEQKKDKALDLLDDMLRMYKDLNDYHGMGLCDLASADVHLAYQELQEGINKATSAAEFFESVGDVCKRGTAVLLMGKAFETAEQLQDTWQCAEGAFAFFDEARDTKGKAASMEMGGNASLGQRIHKMAAYCFENAAFLYRQLKDRAKEAAMLDSLAKAQLASFDIPEDTPEMGWQPDDILAPVRNSKRSCALYMEIGAATSKGHGLALQTFALALLNTTGVEEAYGRTLEARRIFKLLEDPGNEAGACITGSKVLLSQGQKEQALAALDEALEIAEGSEDPKIIQTVKAEIENAKGKKAAAKGNGIVQFDIFVAHQGIEKYQFEAFQCRAMSFGPPPGGGPKKGKDRLVALEREVAPRRHDAMPVLYEARKVPANSLLEQPP